jgi:hypothetical protein
MPRIRSDAGMQIDRNDAQSSNADFPIANNTDPDSNASDESDRHSRKQYLLSFLTDAGMSIDRNSAHERNARRAIRVNPDPRWKVHNRRYLQQWKHSMSRISTDEGIQIDRDVEDMPRLAELSIRVRCDPDSNAINLSSGKENPVLD